MLCLLQAQNNKLRDTKTAFYCKKFLCPGHCFQSFRKKSNPPYHPSCSRSIYASCVVVMSSIGSIVQTLKHCQSPLWPVMCVLIDYLCKGFSCGKLLKYRWVYSDLETLRWLSTNLMGLDAVPQVTLVLVHWKFLPHILHFRNLCPEFHAVLSDPSYASIMDSL